MIDEKAITRFWSKVRRDAPDECWNWQAGKSERGYGTFSVGRKNFRAHRLAYELTSGVISGALIVRHKCDNPSCCNPNHLELGTNKDNTHDAMSRGRLKSPPPMLLGGELAPRAKLSNVQVVEARRLYDSGTMGQTELARQFGVTQAAMYKIAHRKTYRDAG